MEKKDMTDYEVGSRESLASWAVLVGYPGSVYHTRVIRISYRDLPPPEASPEVFLMSPC